MSVSVLGIEIAKQKFDVALLVDEKTKHKACKNSAEGFDVLRIWLEKQGIRKIHACIVTGGVKIPKIRRVKNPMKNGSINWSRHP